MVSLMASARTDNSYFDEKVQDAVGINSQLTTWDIYHFTGGVTITKGKSQLSIGLLYSTDVDSDKKKMVTMIIRRKLIFYVDPLQM